jgi:hypothetical protein
MAQIGGDYLQQRRGGAFFVQIADPKDLRDAKSPACSAGMCRS